MEKRILVCDNCNKKFVGNISACPICGGPLHDGGPVPERRPSVAPATTSNVPNKHMNNNHLQHSSHETTPARSHENNERRYSSSENLSKRGKSQSIVIKIVSVVLVAVMVLLAIVSGKTNIFVEDEGDKTVLFSSMNSETKESFSSFINHYSLLFEEGYSNKNTTFESILAKVKPSSASGLYASFFEQEKVLTDGLDPAKRFNITDKIAGYTKADKQKINEIAESMGLSALEDINTKDIYFYDGVYYFVEKDASQDTKYYSVVKSSKKTNSGDYYCECDIYSSADALVDTSGLTPEFTRYILVGVKENENGLSWKLKEISLNPLYSNTGARIETEEEEGKLSFKIKRKNMVARTESGVVFANYYIEYPVFDNSGIAQAACDSIYSDKLEEFKTKIGNADNLYSAFKDDGGTDEMLPLYTNVVVSVKYNKDGCFSLLEKVTEYNPIQPPKTTNVSPTAQNYNTTVTEQVIDENQISHMKNFCESVYEGITFKTDSGDFIKKDQLFNGDYKTIIDTIYSIYSETNSSTGFNAAEITSENEYIGSQIYNSAWTLGEDGMSFYYVGNDGLEIVTIPWSQLNSNAIK